MQQPPLCRRHHRLKTAGLLTIEVSTDPDDPPGTWVYVTRTGRSYPSPAHAPLPPGPRGRPPIPGAAPPTPARTATAAEAPAEITATESDKPPDDPPPF